MVLGGAVDDRVTNRLVLGEIIWIDMPRVEEPEMRGVDLALERLQIIALALDKADANFVFGKIENLKRRQRRRLGARAHVNPDHAGALDDLVGFGLDLLLEAGRRQARHVEAVPR